MSYPDPRYFADSGEVSATFRPDGLAPEIANPKGTMTHYLATGESTVGKFGLYRWEMGPTKRGRSMIVRRIRPETGPKQAGSPSRS